MKHLRADDAIVVGGGPAGLASAIRLRLAGMSVQLFERARGTVDKACGEGLMPDGVARLEQMGVALEPGEGSAIRGIRYVDEDGTCAEGRFPGPPGLGVRRLALHRALSRRAAELGVVFHRGVSVQALTPAGVVAGGATIPGRWVALADGLHSRLRSAAGIRARPGRFPRYGVRRHYAVAPWSDLVEVHWTRGCEAYVTPVGPDLVGVALLWSGGGGSFDALLARLPALARRLAGAEVLSRDRGAGPLELRVAGVVRGNVALVGDASGYVDAITGEGLSLAFHQAEALARAIGAGDLRRYAAADRAIRRLPDLLTRLLLAVERRPGLRRRTIRALAADPALFSRLLAVHAREIPPRSLGLEGVLRLARGLVRGRLSDKQAHGRLEDA